MILVIRGCPAPTVRSERLLQTCVPVNRFSVNLTRCVADIPS
eukprot:COSAG02_NODE_1396_length_12898_cov_23.802953_6_plen_42_part_00